MGKQRTTSPKKKVPITESDSLFRALVDHSLTGILITTAKGIIFTNQTFQEITGYTPEDIRKMGPYEMVHPEERERVRKIALARLKKKKVRDYYETRWIRKDGEVIWIEVRATVIDDFDEPATLVNVVDITERKRAEEALKKREAELEVQSRKLEETNTALRVLLDQRNEDRIELQKNILFNVEKLIMPFVEDLEKAPLDARHMAYVKIIKSNLHDIIDPFYRELSATHPILTPRQIQVANLIKVGKTTKEIAEILCVSKAAVDFHRDKIRKKLGLTNKKVNLRSYLSLAGKTT
ncbi:MAG: PAS domain S-box protein [Deltaproteobacteria bacterium]|nr:PAS domain S-box protein [Deltaproteobacteria bacterium]MBW2015803.1 PAS domain S-box protein [Deltaproteobacteria bacterium]MBW2129213.1 PAS domain S-box protein [Deltaproteobacteria bacterium]MBW2303365.1 PAS domain S-box protein [Deltaproteobacteria bacterium]